MGIAIALKMALVLLWKQRREQDPKLSFADSNKSSSFHYLLQASAIQKYLVLCLLQIFSRSLSFVVSCSFSLAVSLSISLGLSCCLIRSLAVSLACFTRSLGPDCPRLLCLSRSVPLALSLSWLDGGTQDQDLFSCSFSDSLSVGWITTAAG